jgi:malate dehydrogenase (oxaloacetate-decarboxylating)
LDARAREVNEAMKLAAARAIAETIPDDHLSDIVPSVFNRHVVRNVARAVARQAHETGVARRKKRTDCGL